MLENYVYQLLCALKQGYKFARHFLAILVFAQTEDKKKSQVLTTNISIDSQPLGLLTLAEAMQMF